MPERYEFPEGHHMAKLFPVEGDSAIAELWFGEAPWEQISLTGIDLDAVGDERVSRAGFSVSLFPPLSDGKEWLLDNERGRLPLEDETGLTAAGRAMDKATHRLEP